MVGMVVGQQDGCQPQTVLREEAPHGRGITRVDRDGVAAIVEHPDVVVLQ